MTALLVAFLVSTIDLRRNKKTVPMHEFGDVGFINYVDGDLLPFLHPQDRAWRGTVVTDRADDAGRAELHCNGRNPQREIRF